MNLPLLAVSVLVLLGLGYRFYGRFVARQYALDPNAGHARGPARRRRRLRPHPAVLPAGPALQRDRGGRARSRARSWPASSSAGCRACSGSRVGVVFIGAVHDFSSLIASVRHGGRSIAEIVRQHLGRRAWLAMMAFIWVALVYVIVAFADITASTFVGRTEDLAGSTFAFNQGGAVALASCLYLLLAVVMGLVDRWIKPPLWLTTLDLRAGDAGGRLAGHAVLDAAGAARPHLGHPDPRLLLRWRRWSRCGRCSSRAATWAASCSTWRSRWAWSASSSAASRSSSPRSRPGTRPARRAPCSRSCS